MQHTYLRYECADTFGITASSASSKAPHSNSILAVCRGRTKGGNAPQPIVLTTAGSVCMGFHLRTTIPTIKIGHREQLSGGVGTGRALNSDQLVCLDVTQPLQQKEGLSIQSNEVSKVATGWVDGAVRVFDIYPDEWNNQTGGFGLIQTLLHEYASNEHQDFVMREPLVLNGHSGSPVRTVAFCQKTNTRLASGSSDGSVVLWDIIAETGLFRLLGHRGGITDIKFVNLRKTESTTGIDDYLITSSLDGLVKVWDLNGQCCTQTIPNHKGEVWGIACHTVPSLSSSEKQVKAKEGTSDDDEEERIRLLTGSNDGQVRVWSVQPPKRTQIRKSVEEQQKQLGDEQNVSMDIESSQKNQEDMDTVCGYMGPLTRPPNVATSSERISCIHFHPNGRYVGVLHANSKNVDVYIIRSVQDSIRKKQRRLRRRKEKSKHSSKQESESSTAATKGTKRGLLDDPESEEEGPNGIGELAMDQSLDPEMIKASDEFEYYGTVRASHKVKGFVFVNAMEKRSGIRVVCALSTNSLETHSLIRKKER